MREVEWITILRRRRVDLTNQLAALDLLIEASVSAPDFKEPTATEVPQVAKDTHKVTARKVKIIRPKFGSTGDYVSFISKEVISKPYPMVDLARQYWKTYHMEKHGNGKPLVKRFTASFCMCVKKYIKDGCKNGPYLILLENVHGRIGVGKGN